MTDKHEYTPTTEQVRDDYCSFAYDETDTRHEASGAEFERWLAAHDAEVREQAAQKVEVLAGYAEAYLARSALYIAATAIREM